MGRLGADPEKQGERPERIREMRTDLLPDWLRAIDVIRGFDADDDEDEDDEEEDEDEDEEDEDDEESDDESEDDDDEDEDDEEEDEPKSKKKKGSKTSDEDLERIRGALRKERQLRKELQREMRQLKRGSAPPKKDEKSKGKKGESEEQSGLSEEDQRRLDRAEKLSAEMVTQRLDTTIIRLLPKAKANFRDLDDVLRLVNRDDIDWDQDEDDPSKITIDEDTVIDAIRALAKKKPHLLNTDSNGRKPKSGSKVGGKRRRGDDLTEEQLKTKYPALNR